MSRVFRKTALGIATFTKQNSGLTQSQRAMLIMVDGKRSASDLRRFGATFGDVNQLLRELYDVGLIELDPAYFQKALALQEDIANENEALGMSFGSETALGATRPLSTDLPGPKHDLRNFVSVPPPAPPNTVHANAVTVPMPLSLAPIDGESGHDDLPISAASQTTLIDVKECAKRYLFNALGSSGTSLCLAIERAADNKQLMSTLMIARDTLREMKGDDAAQALFNQLRTILSR